MNDVALLPEAVIPLAPEPVLAESYLPDEKARPLRGPSWSILVLTWIIRFSAALNLICFFLPAGPRAAHWLAPWTPFEICDGIKLRMFLTAGLLFILAGSLKKGKRMAWALTLASLAITPLVHIGYVPLWPHLFINMALIAFLLHHRRHFVVQSDRATVRSALLICSLLTAALLAFGTVRLHKLVDQTSGGDDWGACLQTAVELVLAHKAHAQEPQTARSSEFFVVLRVGGTAIAIVGLLLMLRPVLVQHQLHAEDRDKARKLIDQYGDDPFDAYALLEDKSFFISEDGRAAIPYVRSGNFAVALADPIGPAALRSGAIVEFALFCREQDWEPVFYLAKGDLAACYRQAGFSLFKIGEGTPLRADQFQLKGQEFQNLRTLRNRAQRLGITFRWYDASEGVDDELERQLAAISDCWLKAKKACEMSFDMGSFAIDDLRRTGAAMALDPAGKALAFATWRPFAQGRGRTLDLMRMLPEAHNVMDFVLVESIFHFKARGVTHLDLGLAPLANTEKSPARLVAEEKVVQLLFENLNQIYGYKSLFDFKRKYRPAWCARHVAYRRGVHLPLVGLALLRVHAPAGVWKFLFP